MQDFRRQFGVAVRWLPLILICAIGTSALAYSYFEGQPKLYQSTSHLIVDPGPGASIANLAVASETAARYARQAESLPFAAGIIDALKLDESPRSFVGRISTEVDEESPILSVSATAGGAQQARRIANAVGEALIAEVRRDLITPEVRDADTAIERNERLITQLNRRRVNLQSKANKTFEEQVLLQGLPSEIAGLEASITQLRPFSSSNVRNLTSWFEKPRVPADPIEPRPLYWALLTLVVGGMLAVAIAFVVEYLRIIGKVREERDLELATGFASLGTIFEAGRDAKRPNAERLVMLHYPRSDEAAAYRSLVARIGFSGGSSRTLMVTSARQTEARSLVAANIALAFAEASRNVILVDADYRSPHIHSFFGVRNDRGLTTILTDSSVPLGWATVPSPHPRLGLMTSGPVPPENAEPLGSKQLNALLRRLLQAADVVIFDSPAIESSLDAAVLAEEMHAMLVVPRDSKEDEVEAAAQTLQMAGSDFVGAVLYRRVRRSRKGAEAKLPPAPEGWGPTWPMLYDQPARIPAVTRSAEQGALASRGQALLGPIAAPQRPQSDRSPSPGEFPPHQEKGRAATPAAAAGPYSRSFRPAPIGPPAPAPAGQTPPRPAPAGQTPPMPTSPADLAQARGPSAPMQAAAAESRPATLGPALGAPEPRQGNPTVAVPVQPQQPKSNGSAAQPPTSDRTGVVGATSVKQTSPESVSN